MFLAQSKFTFSKLSYVEVEDPSYAFDGACEWVTLSMEMKNWGAKIFDVSFDLFNSTGKINSNYSPSIEKNDSFSIHNANCGVHTLGSEFCLKVMLLVLLPIRQLHYSKYSKYSKYIKLNLIKYQHSKGA